MASKSEAALAKRKAYQREYRRKKREATPNYDHAAHYKRYGYIGHIRRKYGLTESQYNIILASGGFCCHICRDNNAKLVVDHCHATGEVRGLLCKDCNFVLGRAKDDVNILKEAIDYLERRKVGPLMLDWRTAQERLKELYGD